MAPPEHFHMPSPILRAVLDGDEATAEGLLAADDTKLLVNSDDEVRAGRNGILRVETLAPPLSEW
jgi:hypothetical protein